MQRPGSGNGATHRTTHRTTDGTGSGWAAADDQEWSRLDVAGVSRRAIEKAGGHKGRYHVLLGALSPLEGIGPKDLRIQELKARIQAGGIREVILATDSDLEGETTALYLTKELKGLDLHPPVGVSRLAFGIPMGSSIEYADQVTLSRALEGRRPL